MTNRERFLRTMHYEPVDYPPVFLDGPWSDTYERWYTEGYPKGMDLGTFLGVAEPFKYHGCGIDTFLIPAITPAVIEETDEYILRRDCYGATLKDFKGRTTMPFWLDYAVKTPADLLALTERLEWHNGAGRIPADWDAKVAEWRRDRLGAVAYGGSYYGILRNLMGMEALSLMYYDAPYAIRRYSDVYHELIMRILEKIFADLKGEVIMIQFGEDFAYKTAPLLSPALYREFIMPYHRAVVDLARSHGVDLFFFDSDGNINEMLPHMLEAGINLIYPVECAADMDPLALRRTYGRQLRMLGGIDKMAVARGPAAIEAELQRKVPPLLREGGFMPRIDHSVGTDISLPNFVYYFRRLKELCGMPENPAAPYLKI
ncbi:MAG: hypothetical protein L6437_02300 [Kiritimatiellae bacterium]|nr:hypothetical protein [Kiritimatiellia bacterium]